MKPLTRFLAKLYTILSTMKGGCFSFMKPNKAIVFLLTEILQRLCSTQESINQLQFAIQNEGAIMSAAFDRLKASVDTLSATDQKLIDIVNAGVTGTPDADVSALADAVDAESAKVQAAVDAHTPIA